MNTLLDIQDKIRATSSAIGRLEEQLSRKPSRGMEANILSLRKLHLSLQEEFAAAADSIGMDVCHYKMLNDRPSAKALANAIGYFQNAFSQVFESVRSGVARSRQTLSTESEAMSELQVAYTFPGSFGVAFTVPNSRLLFDIPTQLDIAAKEVLEIVSADSSSPVVANAVQRLGRAPIVAIYSWAKANAQNGVGAGIEWKRGDKSKQNVIIQAPQFEALSQSFEQTGESAKAQLTVEGILVGADIKSHRFHFFIEAEDRSIKGSFQDAISESHQAKLPAKYRAFIAKTTEIRLATEVENETYFLERLEDIAHQEA